MALRRIRVRNTITGDIAEITPDALKHFPAFEPADDAPEAVFAEPDLPPAEAVETTPKTSRRAAAKNEEE